MFFTGLFGLLGSALGGFFGLKKAQGQAIQGALKVVSDANTSEGQREAAIASIIAAENSSGFWLSAVWRPLTMIIFVGMIVSFWFGYAPAGLMADKMPPMIAELFSIVKIGIGGYIGARTLEKVMSSMNVGKVLQKFIEKKLG